jgi:predicted HAD superfamily Cof-like phosphohydrolase
MQVYIFPFAFPYPNLIVQMTLTSEKSNFQKVGEFHTVFEHPINDSPDASLFESNPKLVSLRYALIEEETRELIEAVKSKDLIEMIDALADIDYVVHGAGLSFGINMDTLMKLANIPKTHSDPEITSTFFSRFTEENTRVLCNEFETLLHTLKNAFETKNIMEIAVAFLKIVEKTYQVAYDLHVDLDEAFAMVHRSNMTKACLNEEQARETLAKYQQDLSIYKEPAIKKSTDGKYWIVYDKATGKTLKSKYYQPVDLSMFCDGKHR